MREVWDSWKGILEEEQIITKRGFVWKEKYIRMKIE